MQDIGHYAQSIVDQFSSLLNIPISITDKSGVIVGSTDNNRIGSLHMVTPEVTRSGKIMFFTKEQTQGLENVYPGIAAPLRFQQETVGVLGLIGDPALVERYLQFVQSHIEMLLKENFHSRTVVSQMEMMREFFQHFFNYQQETDFNRLQSYFEMHGFSLDIPRRCVLLDLHVKNDKVMPKLATGSFSYIEQDLYQCLTRLFTASNSDLVAPLSNGQWIILVADDTEDPTQISKRLEYAANKLQNFLESRDLETQLRFFFSTPVSSIEGIVQTFDQTKKALEIANRNDLQQSIISAEDWQLLSAGFIGEISFTTQWTIDCYIEKLLNHANGAVLIECFIVFCEEQLNMSQAAKKLYIHRNTLLYRLQQLQQILSIDLRCFQQCTLLYLALKQHQTAKIPADKSTLI